MILIAVITLWTNARNYMQEEINRAGFGELTAWVREVSDIDRLVMQIQSLEEVGEIDTQNLIFSEYETNTIESDSEGQMILYQQDEDRYRFFNDDLTDYVDAPEQIEAGQVYVSPSLVSMMDIAIGDSIIFPIARNGNRVTLTVAGFYEDPFMGSSMIGMKGFLISEADYDSISQNIAKSSFDALAKRGAMLHIEVNEGSNITATELNQLLNEQTSLSLYTEFIYSQNAILDYMLILQNAFCGLLLTFTMILLCVVLVVIGHSISGLLEQEYVNFGILKTMGFTGKKLGKEQLLQYLLVIVPGMLLGILLGQPVSSFISGMTLTTTGIRIPTGLPVMLCSLIFVGIFLLFVIFINLKLQRISRITPMRAIRGETEGVSYLPRKSILFNGVRLEWHLAIRQLLSGKQRYVGVCVIAILLTFFASMVGRMDSWLGSDGKGMMDAFNPADHDIGVQALGNINMEEAEQLILSYTGIADSYLLAMPDMSIEGINYSANVITEPERFHILEGKASNSDTEVVLTESVAADMEVSIGDTLQVRGDKGSAEFVVSGIYQCANDMGNNIGMSKEAYLKIGNDNEYLWCYHYFLEDSSLKKEITEALETAYGGDIHVHENTWPGLFGIIAAMQALVIFFYGMVALFIFIVTIMTGSKILNAEQKDMGIYQAIGFSTKSLRLTFALRFSITAAIGALLGMALSAILTDPIVSAVMRLAGISHFASHPSILQIIFPVVVVTLLFTYFSWLIAGKIKKIDLNVLISD